MSLVCLVTGASRGIGRASAEVLASRGHHVYAGMREPTGRNRSAAAQVGERATVVDLDVSDDNAAATVVSMIEEREGRLDAIVNNAAYGVWGPVEELEMDVVRRLFETNVFGALRVAQAAIPGMRRRGGGVVVQISSVSGFMPEPLLSAYSATKFALEALSESLALEVRPFGVRVVVIEPGDYATGFIDAIEYSRSILDGSSPYVELHRQMQAAFADVTPGDPSEVAEVIADAIEDPATPLRVPVGPIGTRLAAAWRSRSDEERQALLIENYELRWE